MVVEVRERESWRRRRGGGAAVESASLALLASIRYSHKINDDKYQHNSSSQNLKQKKEEIDKPKISFLNIIISFADSCVDCTSQSFTR